MADEPSVVQRHRRALAGLDAVIEHADRNPELWSKPSPCEGWTAADVLTHVTGIHHRFATELGESCEIAAGWPAVRDAALRAMAKPGALDAEISMPVASMPAGRFLNILTTDALVHTWDIARAVGADEHLDPELVKRAHEAAIPMEDVIRRGTAFAAKVAVPDDADPQSKMLAFFGRDPR
jgi:uncharacterized protein (TIGR03086 family)